MDKKIKYSVLYLINKSKRRLSLGELFRKCPESIEWSNLMDILQELKKDKFITPEMEGWKLTDEGKKDLKQYLKKIGIIERFNLSKMLSEPEYRIRIIEWFIGSLIITFALSLIITSFENYFKNPGILEIFILLIFIFFFEFVLVTGFIIVCHFLIEFLEKLFGPTITKIKKYIKEKLTYFIIIGGPILVLLITYIVLTTFLDVEKKVAMGSMLLILASIIITILISAREKINKFIQRKFLK